MENTLESLVAPVKELNELTLKTIEKIAEIQVNAIQENAKTSVDSLKSATEIKDLDSLQNYLKGQLEIAQNLSNNATEDAQRIAKIGEIYANGVKELFEKSLKVA
ncbi:MAG: phasin family protein [Proteobacteria bacterium]|nr:phasin family protein [Pseudomonadota bacterium]